MYRDLGLWTMVFTWMGFVIHSSFCRKRYTEVHFLLLACKGVFAGCRNGNYWPIYQTVLMGLPSFLFFFKVKWWGCPLKLRSWKLGWSESNLVVEEKTDREHSLFLVSGRSLVFVLGSRAASGSTQEAEGTYQRIHHAHVLFGFGIRAKGKDTRSLSIKFYFYASYFLNLEKWNTD